MHFLSDLVSADSKPEAYVGVSFKDWYNENAPEFWIILFFGIVVGFILSWAWRGLKNYLEFSDEKNEKTHQNEESDE